MEEKIGTSKYMLNLYFRNVRDALFLIASREEWKNANSDVFYDVTRVSRLGKNNVFMF